MFLKLQILFLKHYTMLTQQDLKLLGQKGISESQIEAQLECFKKGFPFLNIQSAATILYR